MEIVIIVMRLRRVKFLDSLICCKFLAFQSCCYFLFLNNFVIVLPLFGGNIRGSLNFCCIALVSFCQKYIFFFIKCVLTQVTL